jgi:hypothetical protein
MQSLWSNILANEASNPGKFSKRTIDCLATISKSEANLFTQLCQFCFYIDNKLEIVIDNYESNIYKEWGITSESLTHFDSIGLITFTSNIRVTNVPETNSLLISYFNKPSLQLKELSAWKINFTQTGRELAPICGAQPNEEFYDYIVKLWIEKNIIVNN